METKEFFLITLPGLEDLALNEVLEWFPGASSQVEHGGVTVFLPLEQGLAMNLVLKIPTRILLRVSRFKCRDFPKLFQKVSQFPWIEWIDARCEPEVHVSTSKSRLSIKRRIKETCEKAWTKSQANGPAQYTLGLYVRIVEDLCTLSLDTSGALLHKRGSEKHIGKAPLRETIGAAMIQLLALHSVSDTPVELVDPMMGSGTLLTEALMRDQILTDRNFNFQIFKHSKIIPPRLSQMRPKIISLVGLEADKKTAQAAEFNLKNYSGKFKDETKLSVLQGDLFKINSLAPPGELVRWVVCNPPYGKRIKVKGRLKEYYENLLEAIQQFTSPDLTCILIPKGTVKGKLKLPGNWKVLEKREFSNGGIPIVAYVFKRDNFRSGSKLICT